MTTRKEIVEYMRGNRIAIIFDTPGGYEIDLYENDNFIETRKAHNHSKEYAMDLADNWILNIIKTGE